MQTINYQNTFPRLNLLPASIQRLVMSLEESELLTAENAAQSILDAKITEQDLFPWISIDRPIMDSYGRKMVHRGDNFEIMVMSWLPGDFSGIHDHGDAEWGAVQYFGKAQHISYEFENKVLKTLEKSWINYNDVLPVHSDLIHQMGNIKEELFLTLHVYGSNEDAISDSITADTRIFDLFEGAIQYTDGGAFFCLPEDQISDRVFGIQGDVETTLRHHELMYDRILRILKDSAYASEDWSSKAAILEEKIQYLKKL